MFIHLTSVYFSSMILIECQLERKEFIKMIIMNEAKLKNYNICGNRRRCFGAVVKCKIFSLQ